MLSNRHSSSVDENANNTKQLLTTGFKAEEKKTSLKFHWNLGSLQYVSIKLGQMSEVNHNACCNARQLSPDVLMTIVLQLSF